MENEDNTLGADPTLPSEEKSEVNPEVKPEGEPQDIDFKKEAERLATITPPKPKRTPQEEAAFNLKKNAERAKELGVDPNEVLGIESKDEGAQGEFVTKDDFAENFARTLVSSEDELRVVMWQYRNGIRRSGNIHEDIENAHLLANKGRLKNTFAEMKRKVMPPSGAGESSGQIPKETTAPELSRDQHAILLRRGYKLVKPGLYQARFNQRRYDPDTRTWVDERISK